MLRYASALARGASRRYSVVTSVIQNERRRQLDQLVLIPSESICLPEVAKIMESDFANIYCEGQPNLVLNNRSQYAALDGPLFKAWHNRLSDGRFYRGCEQANRVELLAKLYVARAFAALKGSPAENSIHVTVQALSGSPANLAIYAALLKPGDNLMSLDLTNGGHLSHGSPYNVSGKLYNALQYGIDPKTRQLDYDQIRKQARQFKPRMIVAGSSAYPWDWDWATLRSIADENGAYLHADVCHNAGMIVGGHLANPLPYADVVMFTTHKTLCGPRGAAIVTKCSEIGQKIDLAVFPGFQGGPHMNSIAGIARLFEIITSPETGPTYKAMQAKVLSNAKAFATALSDVGFRLEYGGTNTHLMLIDLKPFKTQNGRYIDGETASRLLENVGIICNKNTLPGDRSSSDASGLRFGMPWLTQRNISEPQLKTLAGIVQRLLQSARPESVWTPLGDERVRARVPYDELQRAKKDTLDLAASLPYPVRTAADSLSSSSSAAGNAAVQSVTLRGPKARLALNQALTCNILGLKVGDSVTGDLLDPAGKKLGKVAVKYASQDKPEYLGFTDEDRFTVTFRREDAGLLDWLSALSDGYVQIHPTDVHMKVDGPFALDTPRKATADEEQQLKGASGVQPNKPFYIGQAATQTSATVTTATAATAGSKTTFVYTPPKQALQKTVLHGWHAKAKSKLVPFAGWEMPVEYPTGIFKEHAAVRSSAGLFDVSHMGIIEVSGPNALPFLESVFANSAARLGDNEAQYSYMLRENGTAIDDLYVYRLQREKYMVVLNAANYDHDVAWLTAVNEGKAIIDQKNPAKRTPGPVTVRPLRDSLIDLAFQGPLTMTILQELARDEDREALSRGKLNDIHHIRLFKDLDVLACRTGYTGEECGYELFVRPDKAQFLWEGLLDKGASRGVMAIGLGARDSLRTEAGFPLFGHELEGPESLSLTEADYGFVSRLHRPFYIGREDYIARLTPRKKRLIRFRGEGKKVVRGGHAILDSQGKTVGAVTSSAFTDKDFSFYAIAAVNADFNPAVGATVQGYREAPGFKGAVDAKKTVDLKVCTRFPSSAEKKSWAAKYAK